MKFENVYINSFAYQDPSIQMSSTELEEHLSPVYKRLKLPEGRLEMQTGIKNRGYWEPGTRPSSIAVEAGIKALEVSTIKKEEIDLLIHASVCRDFLEPATSSVIHYKLGLSKKAMCFDLSNACLGVVNALSVAGKMIDSGAIKNALIVSGENSGPLLLETIETLNNDMSLTRKSIKKYITNLTIGSAGVAFILSADETGAKGKLLGGEVLCDTVNAELCLGDGNVNSLMMETHSEELLHAGTKLAIENWERLKENLSWDDATPDHVICHQIGVAHKKLMYESLNLNIEKDFMTYENYGNTGSAAVPLTLIKAYESKKIKANDRVAMLGIGSGIHSIMLGIEWLADG